MDETDKEALQEYLARIQRDLTPTWKHRYLKVRKWWKERHKEEEIDKDAPPAGHRPATCEEVDCSKWKYGWKKTWRIDDHDLRMAQMRMGEPITGWSATPEVRHSPGSSTTVCSDGTHITTYAPGTKCHDKHYVPIERHQTQTANGGYSTWWGDWHPMIWRETEPRRHFIQFARVPDQWRPV